MSGGVSFAGVFFFRTRGGDRAILRCATVYRSCFRCCDRRRDQMVLYAISAVVFAVFRFCGRCSVSLRLDAFFPLEPFTTLHVHCCFTFRVPPLNLFLSDGFISPLLVFRYRPENEDWVLSTTTYGAKAGEPSEHFISAVQKGNVTACQFHPEKSGKVGWFRIKPT